MLGKAVFFEKLSNEQFNIMEQKTLFREIFMSEVYVKRFMGLSLLLLVQ
ncbi:hypothetical protein [Thermodesulfobacterium hveragerdense]|nr:hypothetical protein [Thermodesulfobacterium hveragerdense]